MAARNLVTTDWLDAHLHDAHLRIVDIRGHTIINPGQTPDYLNHYDDYVAGHIPGAIFLNWVEALTDDPQTMKTIGPRAFAEIMGERGIGPDHLVIAYDDAAGSLAARLWWTLHYYGHKHVAVLDGGWLKWLDEERPTTIDMPLIEATQFAAQPHPDWRRTGTDMFNLLNSSVQIVDVRTPDEFNGATLFSDRSGHIPGAVNIPTGQLTAADGTLLPPAQLRHQFEAAGIDSSAPEIVFYSNFGVDACLGVLAVHHLGLTQASHYDGGWYEWSNDDTKPVEVESFVE